METFDPHYDEAVAKGEEGVGGQVPSIKTRVSGIEIGAGLPLVAERMDKIALVRSVVSKEGDHERATYNVKNGSGARRSRSTALREERIRRAERTRPAEAKLRLAPTHRCHNREQRCPPVFQGATVFR